MLADKTTRGRKTLIKFFQPVQLPFSNEPPAGTDNDQTQRPHDYSAGRLPKSMMSAPLCALFGRWRGQCSHTQAVDFQESVFSGIRRPVGGMVERPARNLEAQVSSCRPFPDRPQDASDHPPAPRTPFHLASDEAKRCYAWDHRGQAIRHPFWKFRPPIHLRLPSKPLL